MVIVLAHHDADGMFSLAFIYRKYKEVENVYFTSPQRLKKVMCRAILENDPDNEVYIVDLSGNQALLRLVSYFDQVHWLDHHIWPEVKPPENVKLVIKHTDSAARIVAEYLGIKDEKLLEVVDKVDSNRVNDEISRFFRDLVGAIKWKYPKDQYIYFKEIAKVLAFEGYEKVLENAFYRILVEDFRKWLGQHEISILINTRVYETRKGKAMFIFCKERIPTYYIMEVLDRRLKEKYDYIFIVYQNFGIRIEIRTQTGKNVNEIARMLGGGGRIHASGVTLKDSTFEEALETILNYLNNVVG